MRSALVAVKDSLVDILKGSRNAANAPGGDIFRDLIHLLSYNSDWYRVEYFLWGSARSIISILSECSDQFPAFRPYLCELLMHIIAELCLHRCDEDTNTILVPSIAFILSALINKCVKTGDMCSTGTHVLQCGKEIIERLSLSRAEKASNWALCCIIQFIIMKLVWLGTFDAAFGRHSLGQYTPSTASAHRTVLIMEALNIAIASLRRFYKKLDTSGILNPPKSLKSVLPVGLFLNHAEQNGPDKAISDWLLRQLLIFVQHRSLVIDSTTLSPHTLLAHEALIAYVAKWTFDFNFHYSAIRQLFCNKRYDSAREKFKKQFVESILSSLVLGDRYFLSLLLPVSVCRKRVAVRAFHGHSDPRHEAGWRLRMECHFAPSILLVSSIASFAVSEWTVCDALRPCVALLQSYLAMPVTFLQGPVRIPLRFPAYASKGESEPPPNVPQCIHMTNMEELVRLSCTLSSILSHIEVDSACEALFVEVLCDLSDFLIHQQELFLAKSSALPRIDILSLLATLWAHFSYALVHFMAARTLPDSNPLTNPDETMRHLLSNLHVLIDIIYPRDDSSSINCTNHCPDGLCMSVLLKWVPLFCLPSCLLWYLNLYIFPLVQRIDADRVILAMDSMDKCSFEVDLLGFACEDAPELGHWEAWEELKSIRKWFREHQFSVLRNMDASMLLTGLGIHTSSTKIATFNSLGVLPNIHEWSDDVIIALEASFRSAASVMDVPNRDGGTKILSPHQEMLKTGAQDSTLVQRKMTSACAKCIFNRDIIHHVASFLNAKRVNVLAQCNKHLYTTCRDRFLWQRRYFERRKRLYRLPSIFADEVDRFDVGVFGSPVEPWHAQGLPFPSPRPSLCKNCYRNRRLRGSAVCSGGTIIGKEARRKANAAESVQVINDVSTYGILQSHSVVSTQDSVPRFGHHLEYLRGCGFLHDDDGARKSVVNRQGVVARRSGCCKTRSDLHDWFGLYWVRDKWFMTS